MGRSGSELNDGRSDKSNTPSGDHKGLKDPSSSEPAPSWSDQGTTDSRLPGGSPRAGPGDRPSLTGDAMKTPAKTDATTTAPKTDAAKTPAKTDATTTAPKTDAAKTPAKTDAATTAPKTDAAKTPAKTDATTTAPKTDAAKTPGKTEGAGSQTLRSGGSATAKGSPEYPPGELKASQSTNWRTERGKHTSAAEKAARSDVKAATGKDAKIGSKTVQWHHHAGVEESRQVELNPRVAGERDRMTAVRSDKHAKVHGTYGDKAEATKNKPYTHHTIASKIDKAEQARAAKRLGVTGDSPRLPKSGAGRKALTDASATSKWRFPATADQTEKAKQNFTWRKPVGFDKVDSKGRALSAKGQRSPEDTSKTPAKTDAVKTATKTDAVKTPAKTDAARPATKTDAVKTAAKTDAAKPATKTDAVKTATKTDAARSATKTDAARSATKTDAVKTAAKTDAARSATKTDAVKTATKTDAVKTATKTDAARSATKTDAAKPPVRTGGQVELDGRGSAGVAMLALLQPMIEDFIKAATGFDLESREQSGAWTMSPAQKDQLAAERAEQKHEKFLQSVSELYRQHGIEKSPAEIDAAMRDSLKRPPQHMDEIGPPPKDTSWVVEY
jgi:hypothetical protein